MKSNKILAAFVVFLILVNCGVLGIFWFNACHQKKEELPALPAGPAFEYLTNTLKLTPIQKSRYEKMRDMHRHFADSINNETRLMRDSFFAYLKNPAIKPEIINSLAKRISTDLGKMDTSTFYHFKRFRTILKAEQQTKFDEIIQDVLHSMGAHPPQGGPNGQQGPPPNEGQRENLGPHGHPLRGWAQPNRRPGNRMPPGLPPPDGPPPGSRPGGPPPNGGPPPGGFPPPDGPPPGSRPGGPPPNGGPLQ